VTEEAFLAYYQAIGEVNSVFIAVLVQCKALLCNCVTKLLLSAVSVHTFNMIQ
jgi:hypothetical protein